MASNKMNSTRILIGLTLRMLVCVLGRLPKSKIVNGKEAQKGDYPWQMLLQYAERHICGGSLVQPDVVLTAAHCVEHDTQQSQGKFTVIAADYNKRSLEGDEQKLAVKNVILHEKYDSRTLENDIALLQLTSNATLSSRVALVKLSDREFDKKSRSNPKCYVSGWGVSSDVTKTTPDILQELQTNLATNKACNESLQRYGLTMTRDMICALDTDKGVCNGDSGGPMGCFDVANQFRQVGIVSWGPSRKCASGVQIYTKVSKYSKWINRQLSRMYKPPKRDTDKGSTNRPPRGGRGSKRSAQRENTRRSRQ